MDPPFLSSPDQLAPAHSDPSQGSSAMFPTGAVDSLQPSNYAQQQQPPSDAHQSTIYHQQQQQIARLESQVQLLGNVVAQNNPQLIGTPLMSAPLMNVQSQPVFGFPQGTQVSSLPQFGSQFVAASWDHPTNQPTNQPREVYPPRPPSEPTSQSERKRKPSENRSQSTKKSRSNKSHKAEGEPLAKKPASHVYASAMGTVIAFNLGLWVKEDEIVAGIKGEVNVRFPELNDQELGGVIKGLPSRARTKARRVATSASQHYPYSNVMLPLVDRRQQLTHDAFYIGGLLHTNPDMQFDFAHPAIDKLVVEMVEDNSSTLMEYLELVEFRDRFMAFAATIFQWALEDSMGKKQELNPRHEQIFQTTLVWITKLRESNELWGRYLDGRAAHWRAIAKDYKDTMAMLEESKLFNLPVATALYPHPPNVVGDIEGMYSLGMDNASWEESTGLDDLGSGGGNAEGDDRVKGKERAHD